MESLPPIGDLVHPTLQCTSLTIIEVRTDGNGQKPIASNLD
jgi:hypothetical protein